MARHLILGIVLSLLAHVDAHPADFLQSTSFVSKPERSWSLWGWAWGAESSVSIVDRSPPVSFTSRPAAFGPESTDPILGYVIPLSSFTRPCDGNAPELRMPWNLGCPSLCIDGPREPERKESWIALVQRGKCQFVDKVREAQRLGAKAVVVGGDDPDVSGNPDMLVNMYSPYDSSDVEITSTFIRYSDYMTLSSLIATSNTSHAGLRTLSLLINTEYSAWEWYSPIITFFVILVLPSILTFMTLLIHRIRAARAAQRDRAPENIVKSLPWRVWTGTGWEKHDGPLPDKPDDTSAPADTDVDIEQGAPEPVPNDMPSTSQTAGEQPWFEMQHECAICLSQFVRGDRVRVLPCHHIFHLDEVDGWLINRKKLCPVCKSDVTQPLPDPKSTQPPTFAEGSEGEIPTYIRAPNRSISPATERTPLLHESS